MELWFGFLTTVSIAAALSVDDCPSNLQRNQYLRVFGESCYEFVLDRKREWLSAQEDCEARHGHLVIIPDAATNQFLYNTLQQLMRYDDYVFIGASDYRTEKDWVWADGTHAVYTNWAPGQPGVGSAAENCAAMWSGDGKWHDFFCHDVLFLQKDEKFICEYPIVQQPITEASTTFSTSTTTSTTSTSTSTTSTSTTTTTMTTTSATIGSTPCPPFECSLDCGLDGYSVDESGCMLCDCGK